MPTHATDPENQTLGGAVKEVAEHASTLARLEIELASLELKKKVTAIGVGLGLLAGAVAIGLYGIGFLFATAAAGLATFLPVWLSLLIVTLVLLAAAALLGYLGVRSVDRGTPPLPQQAIDEAKLTTQALKRNCSG